jgi:hypothetical protein
VRIVERHQLGQRVAPEVTEPGAEVPSGLADVCKGFMADDTDSVDARAGWQRAEGGGIERHPRGPLERDHVAVSLWGDRVSTIGPLMAVSILTSGTFGVTIMRSRRWFNNAENLTETLYRFGYNARRGCRRRLTRDRADNLEV